MRFGRSTADWKHFAICSITADGVAYFVRARSTRRATAVLSRWLSLTVFFPVSSSFVTFPVAEACPRLHPITICRTARWATWRPRHTRLTDALCRVFLLKPSCNDGPNRATLAQGTGTCRGLNLRGGGQIGQSWARNGLPADALILSRHQLDAPSHPLPVRTQLAGDAAVEPASLLSKS